MRYKANHMGYSLNQQGLFNSIVRDPRNRAVKTSPGEFGLGQRNSLAYACLLNRCLHRFRDGGRNFPYSRRAVAGAS